MRGCGQPAVDGAVMADIRVTMRLDDPHDPSMNERREPLTAWERGLRPAASSNRVLLLALVLAVLLAGFALARGWLAWPDRGGAPAPQGASAPMPPARIAPATPAAAPDASAFQPVPGLRVQRFSKCVTRTGAASYSDGPCPTGTRAMAVAVQPDINLADGMSPHAREASMRENSAVAQEVATHERRVAMNIDTSVLECRLLESRIAALDALTRQPLSGSEQDRLRDERKRARDRQFALRCR